MKKIRYIALFNRLRVTLPIKRVIVGPSCNQIENYKRARATIAEGIPVTTYPSASGSTKCCSHEGQVHDKNKSRT